MTRRVRALVSGEVQGVGYRWFVRGQAQDRGLAGSATNLADGRVEVVLEGRDDDVLAVLRMLTGPGAAGRPTGVAVADEDPRGEQGFTTA
ncbi:MAG: Acylphosphatase [Klenkia sp.]|nr:Acylphosphatase [Klenkia sp.]